MKMTAAALLAATAVGLTVLWWMRSEGTGHVAAMLASAQAATVPSAPPREAQAATVGATQVPFLDDRRAGGVAYSAGNYVEAIAAYRAALDRNPDDAETLSNLAQVLVRLERIDEAIPLFQRAIQLTPTRWAYHFNLARAHGLLGRWDQAVAEYEVARKLFPQDYVTEFNLGLAHHKQGNEAAAVEAYRRAIALESHDASFHQALGISLERLQQPSEAIAAYERYLELSPGAPDAEKVRARVVQLRGQDVGRPED